MKKQAKIFLGGNGKGEKKMDKEDVKKVCWHILENCMVVHCGQVMSHSFPSDCEKLVNVVEKSIEDFRRMEEGAEEGCY